MVAWLILDGVLGLEDRAGNELLSMLVGEPVEHPRPLNPNPGHIRKHLEDLHRQFHQLVVSMIDPVNRISLQIRMHMQILAPLRKRESLLVMLRRLHWLHLVADCRPQSY
jgi:hypothetical protein